MYLKNLTIKGFKSFARPTSFVLEPGVTCVVGPNGSGKSNVVDALAWVMGEQGAKTLRGGKMEDVIFAGTASKGPLGRAEVSLTIDNSDGALPIEYSEVSITRTLFRGGGSDYAINGESCRLLDVQELLSDSGLGREMHVIVGQGQLDQVLHATPEDRRGFVEEAAGILKHRRRKEKTLRKLEAMEANLNRLNDLAAELRRQLKPLGRQAEAARSAQTIAAVVRDAKARLLADEIVTLRDALGVHLRSEQERHGERVVLQEQLEQKQLRITRLTSQDGPDPVDAARNTSFGLESAQERLRGLHTLAQQRLALLSGELLNGDTASESLKGEETAIDDEVATSQIQLQRHQGALAEASARLERAGDVTAAARETLDAVDTEIAACSELISVHHLRVTKLQGDADAAASQLAAVRGEVLRTENALQAATERVSIAAAALAEAEADVAGDQMNGTDAGEAYEFAQAEVFEAESETGRTREQLHSLERERDALGARTTALTLALDQRDGSSDLVAARLSGVRGLLVEQIRTKAGYETAIAAALGTLADAVLVDDRDTAFAAIEHARDNNLGRVELVTASGVAGVTPDAHGLTPAVSVVDAPDGVRALLASVLIADDLDAARAVPESAEPVTVITRDGTVLGQYVLSGGSGTGPTRLELISDRDAAAERHTTMTAHIEQERVELAKHSDKLRSAKERSSAALAALREFDADVSARAEKFNRARALVEAANAELDRLGAARHSASERVAEAEARLESARTAHDTARAEPRPVLDVSARDGALVELERARESEVTARLELETARERVRAEKHRLEELQRRQEQQRHAREEAARRAAIREHKIQTARAVMDALPAVLSSVDASVAEARRELAHVESERAAHTRELAGLREQEAELRQRLQGITESVHGLELQIYEKKLQLSSLLERADSELGLGEEVLVAEYGPEQTVPGDAEDVPPVPFRRDEQERRLKAAERKLSALGRVNPLALEEFAALEQRHAFLTEQLNDLTQTRKDLHTITRDIDEKMQIVFAEAFEDTKAAFAEVFPVLFPGGTGNIALTNPDDMLTTGIEVSVKPAGKKIERLSLLSGGERSLAAVALLIAIFKARPSPFYILDEVEAALDDANLGRLLTVLEGLRGSSQLIIITHQKRTMEIADALYGVSMHQDGVSAVIGQRVREEQAS